MWCWFGTVGEAGRTGEGKGLCRGLGLKSQGNLVSENMVTRGRRLFLFLVVFPDVWCLCNSKKKSYFATLNCLGSYLYRRFCWVQGIGVFGQRGFLWRHVRIIPTIGCTIQTYLPCRPVHPSGCQLIALNWMVICTSVVWCQYKGGSFLFINQNILFSGILLVVFFL